MRIMNVCNIMITSGMKRCSCYNKIAALMKNAKNNENVLSIVANLMASFFLQ
jgi:hypothetical protein